MMGEGGGIMFWIVALKDIALLWIYTLFIMTESFFQWIFPPKMKSLKDEIILVIIYISEFTHTL